eukprot:m51a1_g6155 hypothetical protein (461) ;mRNA; f:312170-314668
MGDSLRSTLTLSGHTAEVPASPGESGRETILTVSVFWQVTCCAFSPDGSSLATSSCDRTLRLWRTGDGCCLASLLGHTDTVWCCAFSPDGTTLASASADGTARLWCPGTGACRTMLQGHASEVYALAYSPNGKALVTTSLDKSIRLWDTAAGTSEMLGRRSCTMGCVAFSPDGAALASGSDDATVNCCAYSPDGAMIASAADDNTVRLWRVSDNTCTAVLRGHTDWRHAAWFRANDISGEVLDSVDLKSLQLSPPECKTLFQALETLKACGMLRVTHAALLARSEGLEQQKRDALLAVTWDMVGVAKWMQSQGLPEDVRAVFRERQVRGEEVVFMRVEELRDMGITSLGKRVAVFKKITELRTAHLEALAQCFKLGTAGAEQAAGPAVPQEYVCPITLRVMENPVVAPDGHIYEASAIGQWMQGHSTSPVTGQHMESGPCTPCRTLHAAIKDFLHRANNT